MGSQNVGNKSVYVISGTGTRGVKQVNVTGTTGSWPIWNQLTAAQFAQGPTGEFETIQRVNPGTALTQAIKTARISGFVDPNSGGGGGYTAAAVHFDGSTYLENAAVTGAPAGTVMVFSVWSKFGGTIEAGQFCPFFVTDPENNYLPLAGIGPDSGFGTYSVFELSLKPTDSSTIQYVESSNAVDAQAAAWQHCLVVATTNANGPPRPTKMYVNDVDVTSQTDFGPPAFGTGPFTFVLDALMMRCFDDGFGDPFVGDAADMAIYVPASSPLVGGDIPLNVRRAFISATGKPVNPSTAVALLGTPIVLFSGNAASFATNQGSGGGFSTIGALTNASTSPSS